MTRERAWDRGSGLVDEGGASGRAPGKRTLTSAIQRKAADPAPVAELPFGPVDPPPEAPGTEPMSFVDSLLEAPVQRKEAGGEDGGDVHTLAAAGTAGPGSALPFLDQIQASFGAHDVSGVQAHTDEAAASAARGMGASAFATGNHVAFADAPDLRTAAHEAAHVVQQRAGVHLKGGVGEEGDAYERHADAVANAVVRGESAEALLNSASDTGAARTALTQRGLEHAGSIQRQRAPLPEPPAGGTAPTEGGPANETDLEQDILRVMDNWLEAARAGVTQFVTGDLSSRITSIESGSWRNFLQTLVGGTIWCATAFVPQVKLAQFAVGMAGMAIQALTSLPNQSDAPDALVAVQEMFHRYIEAGHAHGSSQASRVAANIIAGNSGITRYRAIGTMLQHTFKPGMFTLGNSSLPHIDSTAVRTTYRDSGADLLARFRAQIDPIGKGSDSPWKTTTKIASIDGRLAQVEQHNIGKTYRFVMWISDDLRESALRAAGPTVPNISRHEVEGIWSLEELRGIGTIALEAVVSIPHRIPLTIIRANWAGVSREKEKFVQEQFPAARISALGCELAVELHVADRFPSFHAWPDGRVWVGGWPIQDWLIEAAGGTTDPKATGDQKANAAENAAKQFASQLYNMPISNLNFGK